MKTVYLDHAATSPLHPRVLEAMLPYWSEHFGNPSSLHGYGRTVKNAINEARDRIAARLDCRPSELIFTSGGTESDNLAIFGTAYAKRPVGHVGSADASGGHIVTTAIEHQAVLAACRVLERRGFQVTVVPVDRHGRISVRDIQEAVRSDTVLISVMYGNNETGTLQPIGEIGEWASSRGIPFHVDAVQALGLMPIRLSALPVDMMSFSAHKINGPKGIGALYVSRRIQLEPSVYGGAQERGRRGGTENTAAIIGFAEAVEWAADHRQEHARHMERLRERMLEQLSAELGEERFTVNGHPRERLPHILNLSFPGIPAETMLMNLDLAGIAAASGSACTSGALEPSHVLRAMGLPDEVQRSAVRFSFGYGTSEEDIRTAVQAIGTICDRLRKE